jgi:hypothetical protein
MAHCHARLHGPSCPLPQESHGQPIRCLEFNHTSPQLSNLFATVGRDQATIYDDSHLGDFVAIVVHFTNAQTPYHKGGVRPMCLQHGRGPAGRIRP